MSILNPNLFNALKSTNQRIDVGWLIVRTDGARFGFTSSRHAVRLQRRHLFAVERLQLLGHRLEVRRLRRQHGGPGPRTRHDHRGRPARRPMVERRDQHLLDRARPSRMGRRAAARRHARPGRASRRGRGRRSCARCIQQIQQPFGYLFQLVVQRRAWRRAVRGRCSTRHVDSRTPNTRCGSLDDAKLGSVVAPTAGERLLVCRPVLRRQHDLCGRSSRRSRARDCRRSTTPAPRTTRRSRSGPLPSNLSRVHVSRATRSTFSASSSEARQWEKYQHRPVQRHGRRRRSPSYADDQPPPTARRRSGGDRAGVADDAYHDTVARWRHHLDGDLRAQDAGHGDRRADRRRSFQHDKRVYPAHYFQYGYVTWTTGANAGRTDRRARLHGTAAAGGRRADAAPLHLLVGAVPEPDRRSATRSRRWSAAPRCG